MQCINMDQLLKRIKPSEFSSYEEFIEALLIEGLCNYDMTFDQLNYKLYALSGTIFDELSTRSITYYKIFAPKIFSSDMNMFRQ